MNKIILRLIHIFTKHDYEIVGFHNLYGGQHQIVRCDCGKEKYTKECFNGYERN